MSYIKLDRRITEWEWFTDGNMLKLWIYLLTNAKYQDCSYKGIDLKRGQLATGRKKLAEALEMSEQQVRTCLDRLQSTNEITIKTTNKYSVITIVKYAFYQGGDDDGNQQNNQQDNQPITNNQPTNNHNKRNIEINNKRIDEDKYKYRLIEAFGMDIVNDAEEAFGDYPYTQDEFLKICQKISNNEIHDLKAYIYTMKGKA